MDAVFQIETLTGSVFSPSGLYRYILESFLIAILAFGFLSKMSISFYSDLYILMHMLTLLLPAKHFIRGLSLDAHMQHFIENNHKSKSFYLKIMSESYNETDQMLSQLHSLKILSALLTESTGLPLLFYIGEMVLSYGLHSTTSLFNESLMVRTVVKLFYALAVLICVTSAETCRQVCSITVKGPVSVFKFIPDLSVYWIFPYTLILTLYLCFFQMSYLKDWLQLNASALMLNCNEFSLIMDSITRNVVAVSACNVLTITYSFIGAVRLF